MTKLYIGNLPYSVTNDDLTNLFAEYGTVTSASVVSDRETGRSKGFGFVEIEEDAKALEAIEKLDKSSFQERTIFVSVARPREDRPQGGGFSGGGRGGGFGNDRRGGGGGGGFRRDDRRGH